MMDPLTALAWFVYGVVAIGALMSPKSVTINGRPVRNLVIQLVVAVAVFVILPFIGVVAFLIGLMGQFLLLPIQSLF